MRERDRDKDRESEYYHCLDFSLGLSSVDSLLIFPTAALQERERENIIIVKITYLDCHLLNLYWFVAQLF